MHCACTEVTMWTHLMQILKCLKSFCNLLFFSLLSTLKKSLDMFKLRKCLTFLSLHNATIQMALFTQFMFVFLWSSECKPCFYSRRDWTCESITLTTSAEHAGGGQETGGIQRKAKRNKEEGSFYQHCDALRWPSHLCNRY